MDPVDKRIIKELSEMHKNPPDCCSAGPISDYDLRNWQATILGPEGSPYLGGIFKASIFFPNEYPMKPPKITFNTKIYHPNIDERGNICLDILKNNWSAANSIASVLVSICSLLNEPNPDDPLVPAIGQELRSNRDQFNSTAMEWTLKYAN